MQEISLLEIIIFGIAVNAALLFFTVTVTTISLIKSAIQGNFELAIWSEKIKIKVEELRRRKNYSFFRRNEDKLILLLPFSGLLRSPIFLYNVSKYGFIEYVEREIVRENALLDSQGIA